MQVLVKHPRIVNHVLYPVGMNCLPDELVNHWFFQGLVKCGDFKVIEAPKPPVTEDKPVVMEDAVEVKAPSQPQRKRR